MKFSELIKTDKVKKADTSIDVINELQAGPMKNSSQAKINRDGYSMEFKIAGKDITVIMDKDLPMTYIFGKIESLLEDIEKEVKSRL